MKKGLLLVVGAVLLFAGCWSDPTARWKSVVYGELVEQNDCKVKQDAPKEAKLIPTVSVYSYPAKGDRSSVDTPKVVFSSLADHGQQAYIENIAKNVSKSSQKKGNKENNLSTTNDKFREELGKPIVEAKNKPVDIAPTELNRTMVISVSKS